tara:strand:- start:4052 stop:4342 length:291 start_codon:yes stop_codon:yes gene_type:complete
MNIHANDQSAQLMSIMALLNIARNNPDNQRTINDLNGIQSITTAMVSFPSNPQLISMSLIALYEIVLNNKTNLDTLSKSNGEQLIKQAMVDHPRLM